MIVYVYESTTGEYLGQEESDSLLRPDGSIGNGTALAPPAPGANQVALFDEKAKKWSLADDFRGTWWDKRFPGGSLTVEDIGDANPGPNFTTKPAPDPEPGQKILWSESYNAWEILSLTVNEKEEERQAQVKGQIAAELPDLIFQNMNNPDTLAQALCDRAKEIDQLIKISKEMK